MPPLIVTVPGAPVTLVSECWVGDSSTPYALPELKTMAVGEKFAPARILALWSLERLGKLEPQILQTALKAEDAVSKTRRNSHW